MATPPAPPSNADAWASQGYTPEQIAYYQAYAQQQQNYYNAYYQSQTQNPSPVTPVPHVGAAATPNPYMNYYPYPQYPYYNPYQAQMATPFGGPTANTGKRKHNVNNKQPNRKRKKEKTTEEEDEESKLRALKFKTTEDSPEEIARWIAERRNRFPTKERVQLKKESEPKKDKKKNTRGRNSSDSKKQKTRVCSYFQKGKCNKGEECKYLHQKKALPKHTPKTAPTLLQKLLGKVVNQENDVLLQCLQYIATQRQLCVPESVKNKIQQEEEEMVDLLKEGVEGESIPGAHQENNTEEPTISEPTATHLPKPLLDTKSLPKTLRDTKELIESTTETFVTPVNDITEESLLNGVNQVNVEEMKVPEGATVTQLPESVSVDKESTIPENVTEKVPTLNVIETCISTERNVEKISVFISVKNKIQEEEEVKPPLPAAIEPTLPVATENHISEEIDMNTSENNMDGDNSIVVSTNQEEPSAHQPEDLTT